MTKKKIMAMVLALVLCISLVACGEPDPHCGTWVADTFSMNGTTLTVKEVYGDNENSFVLEDGGVGTKTMDGETYDIEWAIEDGKISLGDSSMTLTGDISDTEATIQDFGGEAGLTFHFAKK